MEGDGSKSMYGFCGAIYTTWNRDWIYKCFSNHPTHASVLLPIGLSLGLLVAGCCMARLWSRGTT